MKHSLLLAPLVGLSMALGGCGSSAPAPADTPDAAVAAVIDGIAANDQVVLWDAMPSSMQSDVNGLVSEFAGKMDAEIWDRGFGAANGVLGVLKTKREYILGSPMLAFLPIPNGKDTLSTHYDTVIDLLTTIVDSDIAELGELKSFDGRDFLKDLGPDIIPQIRAIASLGEGASKFAEVEDKFRNITAEVVSTEGDTASVRVSTPTEKPFVTDFVRVDGKWIPADMNKDWPKVLADAKKSLAELNTDKMMKQKPQFLAGMDKIDSILTQLAKADSQEAFNKAIMDGMRN